MHASSQSAVLIPVAVAPPPVSVSPRWSGSASPDGATTSRAKTRPVPQIRRAPAPPKSPVPCTVDLEISERKTVPPWLISLVAHLVFLMVLALITTPTGGIGRLVLTITQGTGDASPELTDFVIESVVIEEISDQETLDVELVNFEMHDVLVAVPVAIQPSDISVSQASPGGPISARMFSGRTGAMKQKLLRETGGTEATEDAVSLGLKWLKRQQQKRGNWSLVGPYENGARTENDISATSMAMLAMMGAGSTHRGGEYKKELLRAVHWLVKQQDRQGFMAIRSPEHEKMYSQAQATIVLCELYAMTGDSWIRPYAQAACDFACNSQSYEGGWRYRPKFDSDTSVTGWFVMALKSGDAGGLKIQSQVWPRVESYLDSVTSGYTGGYSYQIGGVASPSMTAEGLLCRQYMGWHRNMPGMTQGCGALVANHPIDFNAPDVYYWYYATQTLHHYGGAMWRQWNDKLKVALPARQERQGRESGSWSPRNDAWGRRAGRLYTTCFSLYCLEVYYRHMPLYETEHDDVNDSDRSVVVSQ
ncbi:MAG: prenyltransferase/squalene oxidase repeat-containing protein [Rubripirellula sp.]